MNERQVLENLHWTTMGEGWRRQEKWLSPSPLGEWHGISTDPGGRVRGIDLGHNNLDGIIQPGLGELPGLESLKLPGNRLRGRIPVEICRVGPLRNLCLQDNRLTGSIPPELGAAAGLRWLYLANNRLEGEIPAELGGLSLDGLFLAGNLLERAIPEGLWLVKHNDLDRLVEHMEYPSVTGHQSGTVSNGALVITTCPGWPPKRISFRLRNPELPVRTEEGQLLRVVYSQEGETLWAEVIKPQYERHE